MRRRGLRRSLSLVMVTAMLLTGVHVGPVFAAGTFTGGVGGGTNAAPLYFPNDHTALGVHWLADAGGGLAPNTTYNIKVRFTVGTSPSPGSNRGFTWNGASGRWVQESEAWDQFPTVTTNEFGAVVEQWEFVKFGDETKTGSYYLTVSLKAGSADTMNSSVQPVVTVLDMKTAGGWVHNGAAIGQAARRIEVTDPTGAIPWTVSRTETNTVDEDGNGVVDDEDYGPAGSTGDYRLAAPTGALCDIRYTRTTVRADDWTHAYPDCDIAYGAGEMVPPGAAVDATATLDAGEVALDWGAATDADSGVAAYRIYKWEVPETAGSSTPLKERVAEVDDTETAWTDTDVTEGIRYGYEIRAVDVAGNVGRRATVEIGGAAEEPAVPTAIARVDGPDRYATAIEVSKTNFAASSVTTVVVATGEKFPDALAASGLAGVYGSPILLVRYEVTPALEAELERLGATDVILVGGTSAISDAVETELAGEYDVDRIEGADRYETAAAVALRIREEGGSDKVFVARGDDFADALAASPFAWSQMMPVLLVAKTGVPAATSGALEDLGTKNAVVVGGTAAVPESVYVALDAVLTGNLDRWWGADRYATALAVAEGAESRLWGDWSFVGIATGRNFPDALGGGAAAGAHGGMLLLTAPDSLSQVTQTALETHADVVEEVQVFGGPAAVHDAVYDAIVALLD